MWPQNTKYEEELPKAGSFKQVQEEAAKQCLCPQISAKGAECRPCPADDSHQWAKPATPDLEQAL